VGSDALWRSAGVRSSSGLAGAVLGRYGAPGRERQRFRCFPSDGPAHTFTEPLPRRVAAHDDCVECERTIAAHQGLQAPRCYRFPARGRSSGSGRVRPTGRRPSAREDGSPVRRLAAWTARRRLGRGLGANSWLGCYQKPEHGHEDQPEEEHQGPQTVSTATSTTGSPTTTPTTTETRGRPAVCAGAAGRTRAA